MDQKPALIETLQTSRAAMVVQLDKIDRNRKIYPLWTIREILAHLSGWDDAIMAVMRALKEGGLPATPATRGPDAYNEETVATREGLDYDHIQREYLETRKLLLDLLRELPEERVSEPSLFPWGDPGTLAELITIFSRHEAEHAVDVQKIIEDAVNRPGQASQQ